MEEIARSIPMSKGTLYAAFSNKEEIILAICDNHCASLEKMLTEALENTSSNYLNTLQEMLKQYVGSVFAEASSVRTPEALLYVNSQIKTRFSDRFIRTKDIVRSVLDKAIEAKEIAEYTDSELLSEVITSALTPYLPPYQRALCAPQIDRPDRKTFDSEVDLLLRLLLYGLKGDGSS
tara:strand:+ start:289 stop:822 length:534 start_codon:yes stop_codon:yes gene_type:complete